MFNIDVENLSAWLRTANKEIDDGINRSAISLWTFLSSPKCPTMFSYQSSEKFYEAIANTKNLLILRDLMANTLSSTGFGSIMDCESFLEFDLLPQQNRNTKILEADLLKQANKGNFPYVVFYKDYAKELVQFPILSNVNVHNEVASVQYSWSRLEGDIRKELSECIFNPTPDLSLLENIEVLKGLIGFKPIIKLPIQKA